MSTALSRRAGGVPGRAASALACALACALAVAAAGAHAGPWRASDGNTSGWAYMTPKERLEHQATVRAFTDPEACRAYQLRHHAAMAERARAAGQSLAPGHRDLCAHLRPARPAASASQPPGARP
jgi:hypothetical protein